MLTPLQEQVASIVAGLAEAEGFALAGGAALIARGEIQRETRDLDFFGLTPDDVDRLVPAVDRALQEAGLVVRRVQVSPGFARLIVESGDDSTELDLGADARLFPIEPREPAPTLSGEELAVDKVLAVFGRAEPRDFVDLAAVEARYGLDRLFELAATVCLRRRRVRESRRHGHRPRCRPEPRCPRRRHAVSVRVAPVVERTAVDVTLTRHVSTGHVPLSQGSFAASRPRDW